ncbi:MAG: glycosyltransferase, partial [Anaerolineaceae bacterium]|nr:glycosyltransferase [Anaerolineaceae bacterium]
MAQTPLVSIITPSFNQAKYLRRTIESVLNQDYPNLEYMVIDGGSNDGSVEIIQEYTDRLTYWESVKDKGQTDAINKGFNRATGKYVAWLNSDDVYYPGAIREAVA